MKIIITLIALTTCINTAFAQLGVSVAPYFWSTHLFSQRYDNIPLGFCANVNYNNKFFAEFTHYRFLGEKKSEFSEDYGYGVPFGAAHRNFRWTELHVDYSLFGKKWEDMDKWAPAVAVRGGAIFNTRMTLLAPQVGLDSVWTPNPPNYWVDSIVPLNRYDITGVKQTLVTGGLSIKIMRKKKVHASSTGGSWYRNIISGEVFFVPDGTGSSKDYYRVRQWDFYTDIIYAAASSYDSYLGWGDRQASTRSISGEDIPGIENIGWRWGIRHMAYNPLGLQWVIEYAQLPGQKNYPNTEDLAEPIRKNRYFLIGLNFTLGFNAGAN